MKKTAAVSKTLEPFISLARLGRVPFAQGALCLALSSPGVTCVLNGMRAPTYVVDSTAMLAVGRHCLMSERSTKHSAWWRE